jgi:hypothetical protein
MNLLHSGKCSSRFSSSTSSTSTALCVKPSKRPCSTGSFSTESTCVIPASRSDSFRRRVNNLYDSQILHFFGGAGCRPFATFDVCRTFHAILGYVPADVEVQFPGDFIKERHDYVVSAVRSSSALCSYLPRMLSLSLESCVKFVPRALPIGGASQRLMSRATPVDLAVSLPVKGCIYT